MASSPVIGYRREFHFPDPPEVVWAAVEEVDRFEEWWLWLHEFRLDGPGLVDGAVLRGVVAPPLPYRMRIEVELVRCDRPSRVDALIRGDLEGHGELRLHPDGSGTRAEVSWEIEMMQRPMRIASRFALPMLRWGHDRVVEMTVAGFRRRMEPGGR